MAFNKEIITDYGIASSYQVIEGFELDVDAEKVKITVHGYTSKELKQSGVMPIFVKTEEYSFSDLTGDLRELIYPAVAAFPGGIMFQANGDVMGVEPFLEIIPDAVSSPDIPLNIST